MQPEERLKYSERLTIAKDIVHNVAKDLEIMSERTEKQMDKLEYLCGARAALKTAVAVNDLQRAILQIEQTTKDMIGD